LKSNIWIAYRIMQLKTVDKYRLQVISWLIHRVWDVLWNNYLQYCSAHLYELFIDVLYISDFDLVVNHGWGSTTILLIVCMYSEIEVGDMYICRIWKYWTLDVLLTMIIRTQFVHVNSLFYIHCNQLFLL
jgi:hypothetical protein